MRHLSGCTWWSRTLRVLVVAAGVRVLVVARANTRIGRLLLLLTAMLALRVCGQTRGACQGPLRTVSGRHAGGCHSIGLRPLYKIHHNNYSMQA